MPSILPEVGLPEVGLLEVALREVEIREVDHGSALYALTLLLRDAALRRPLGLALCPADHAGEEAQRHFAAVLAAEGGPLVCACVVMKPLEHHEFRRAKLRQMAVAPAFRGTGLGRRLVRFAEAAMAGVGQDARGLEIELHARESAVGFYERLGYEVVGDGFTEVGLPHRPMRRMLR